MKKKNGIIAYSVTKTTKSVNHIHGGHTNSRECQIFSRTADSIDPKASDTSPFVVSDNPPFLPKCAQLILNLVHRHDMMNENANALDQK